MKLRAWQMALLVLVLAWSMAIEAQAREVSQECVLDTSVQIGAGPLVDGNPYARFELPEGTRLTLSHADGIGSVYLIFDELPGEYTLTDDGSGKTHTCGSQGFLHEFVDIEAIFGEAAASVTLDFGQNAVWLNEIHAFTSGPVPDWVQKWEAPTDARADLLLFSAHSDDEQLFFAGLLPYYAGELDYRVQVVYMTDHKNLYSWRVHEALDGLWNVGIRRYPVWAPFKDSFSRSRQVAYGNYLVSGVTEQDLAAFVVEQLRRFRPLVVVTHDINGEYGHGQHMTTADAVMAASKASASAQSFPASAERYGVWDVPKVYLHLYPTDQIWMDWDQPLEHFGGMTAYEVTRDIGFPSHVSQIADFAWYMTGKATAADIQYLSPCVYGLYRSTVGKDVDKNSFFENLTNYDRQDELAQEAIRNENARQEAECLAAEERAREEALRQEAEAALQEAALTPQEPEQATTPTPLAPLLLLAALLTACAAAWYRRKNI